MTRSHTLAVLGMSFALISCSNVYTNKDSGPFDVKSTPPLHLLEVGKKNNDGYSNWDRQPQLEKGISDEVVYQFTFLLEDTMRKRVDHSRTWNEGLSSLQVLLAAFASAFSASTGVHPDVVTSLAGLSALTPDLANIINTGEKAKAYSQGLTLIEDANAAYILARSKVSSTKEGLIPDDKLTPEGAALFVSVMASLKVMRNVLLQSLPSEDDLAKAKGKYNLFSLDTQTVLVEIDEKSPSAYFSETTGQPLKINDVGINYYTRVVSVVRGGNLTKCTSDSPFIVEVKECADGTVTIVPKMAGTANITVLGERDNRAVINVTIRKKEAPPAPSATQ